MAAVRPAGPGDAEAICGLVNRLIRNTTVTFNSVEKTADEIRALIGAGGPCWVTEAGTEAGARVVGYASTGRSGAEWATRGQRSIRSHSCPKPGARVRAGR